MKYNKFMWNIITSNRLVEKKKRQQAQRKHLNALRNIKPSIDNDQPQNFRFLYTRPKQRLQHLCNFFTYQKKDNLKFKIQTIFLLKK